jgi:hypothetical protein
VAVAVHVDAVAGLFFGELIALAGAPSSRGEADLLAVGAVSAAARLLRPRVAGLDLALVAGALGVLIDLAVAVVVEAVAPFGFGRARGGVADQGVIVRADPRSGGLTDPCAHGAGGSEVLEAFVDVAVTVVVDAVTAELFGARVDIGVGVVTVDADTGFAVAVAVAVFIHADRDGGIGFGIWLVASIRLVPTSSAAHRRESEQKQSNTPHHIICLHGSE